MRKSKLLNVVLPAMALAFIAIAEPFCAGGSAAAAGNDRIRPSENGRLISALKDGNETLRVVTAGEMGESRDKLFVPALIAALGDESVAVRLACVGALSNINDARAAIPLAGALRQALLRVNPKFEDFHESEEPLHLVEAIVRALTGLKDARAVPKLAAMSKDEELADRRLYVIESLWKSGGAAAAGPLIDLLKDKNTWMAGQAASALAAVKPRSAVGPLIAALKHKDEKVRISAAHALGQIGDRRAVQPLAELITPASPADVRVGAAEAIGDIKDPASLRYLVLALADAHGLVRIRAVQGLGHLKAPGAVPVLLELLKEGNYLERYVVSALGETGDRRCVEPLKKLYYKKIRLYHGLRADPGKSYERIDNELVRGDIVEALGKQGVELPSAATSHI